MFRRSKFKHVFGKANRKEECYDCIRITKSSWDSSFCSVNPKFVAIITEAAGGGSFLVIPTEKTGRVERDVPLVAGHRACVLDIAWCPHNDNVIASASEDCTVKVWQIPDGGLEENLTEPIADLVAHQRRVGLLVWHPTAENVLLSAGADNVVCIWNVATEEVLVEMNFPDMITSASFNYNGSKLVMACKDKKLRVVNPRNGELIEEGVCHQSPKPQQCVYLKDNRIFTTGFSRMGERQYGLWKDTDLANPLTLEDVDTSNGVLFPFYDPDTGIIFLCGKGDSNIRYFEVSDDDPYVHFLNLFSTSDPQRGFGLMPKRGLNVNQNEITRVYKLHSKGLCEVIPMTVPRKSELFQDDLYPDTPGDVAALTAEEWMAGKNADPILVSLKDGYTAKEKPARTFVKSQSKSTAPIASGDRPSVTHGDASANSNKTSAPSSSSTLADKQLPPTLAKPGNTNSSAPSQPSAQTLPATLPPGVNLEQMTEDIRKFKVIVKGHEIRIQELEERLRVYEEKNHDSHY